MNPIVLLIGDVNVDVIQKLPYYPAEGEESEIKSLVMRAGGTALNVAKVLKYFKITPLIVSAIGDDVFGEFILKECKKLNIPMTFIQRKLARTGTVFSINTPRDRTMFTLRGANKELSDFEELYKAIDKSDVVYFSSYAFIEGEEKETSTHLLRYARTLEKFTVLSLALLSIRKKRKSVIDLLSSFDIVFMNEREYQELFDKRDFNSLNLESTAFVVTKGTRGATYYSNDMVKWINSSNTKKGYLIGAGDAFVGGFIAGWLLYSDISKALECGNNAASDWITRYTYFTLKNKYTL